MYSRRDTFRLLFGAAALAAAPGLLSTGSNAVQAAVASTTGDLLPADGGWFSVTEFPELAQARLAEYEMYKGWSEDPSIVGKYPKPEPILHDGMIRLPKIAPYSERAGLTADGQQVWAHHTTYIKAVPTDAQVGNYSLGVGWQVDVVNYTLTEA